MRVISPFCSALFRRMPVYLFGAAALAFAVLTTLPALAESGENPVASCPENADAELFRAAHRGNVERAKHLLSECDADVNARNYYNQTPLTWAIRSGNVDMVALLLDKEADVHARDKAGHTILHTSVRDNHPEMVEVILAHFRTDVNIKDHYGWTAMDWAAVKGNAHLAGVLKDAGGVCNGRQELPLCNIVEEKSCLERYGWLDLRRAATAAYEDEIRSRIPWADFSQVDWEFPEHTLLYLLARGEGVERIDFEKVRCLIDAGVDVNGRIHDGGYAPLHWAVHSAFNANANDAIRMAELLLENGADVNIKTDSGETPLIEAIATNSRGLIALLLENGADVNAQTNVGWTPLHVAVSFFPDIVELLLENGADINAELDSGRTPLDYALHLDAVRPPEYDRIGLHKAIAALRGAQSKPKENQNLQQQLSAQSDAAREDLTKVVAEGINALPPSFNALATDVGFTRDMKVRLNARRDFRWDGGDWGLEAHIGAVGESDSQAAFTGVGGSKDFAGGWRVIGAAKVARGWTQLEGGLERGALWASEFSAGFERLGLFYGGDALEFGVSQPLHVEHWEAETADGRRFRGSQLSGRVLNVDASYRIPLPGGENGIMEFSAAVGRESGSESGFEGDALISAEWDF